MKQRYLEITFYKGRPLAGYFYLPRNPVDYCARTERNDCGLLIDYASDGRPIGIEITAPSKVTLAAMNQALALANQEPAAADDLAPLLAAHQTAPKPT